MGNMSVINYVDICFYVMIAISTLLGLSRGFIREIIALTILVLAVFSAIYFCQPFANYLLESSFIHSILNESGGEHSESVTHVAVAISYVLIFVGVMIIGSIARKILGIAPPMDMVSSVNRILGGVFGFARGILWLIVVVFLVQLTSYQENPAWKKSKVVAQSQPYVAMLKSHVTPTIEQLQKNAQPS